LINASKRASNQERNGKTPSEALLKDIESLKRQINNNDNFIKDKRNAQEEIKSSHNMDIARYKKLKGIE